MMAARVHILTLHPGDRFRYAEGGPTFRVARTAPNDPVRVEPADAPAGRARALQEIEGCFVIPAEIDEPEEDD